MDNKNSITFQENKIRTFLETIVHQTITRKNLDKKDSFEKLIQIMKVQPQWSEKINNIEQFRVTRRSRYKSLLLQVKVLRCNKWLTVSWKKGVEKKRKDSDPLKKAMRNAVTRQINSWRVQNCIGKKCNICCDTKLLQVDHVDPQFWEIQKNFIEDCKKNEISIPTEFKLSSRGQRFLISDISFRKRWQTYHKKYAVYQWLCRSCNCKKLKKYKKN